MDTLRSPTVPYTQANKNDIDEDMFITSICAVKKIVNIATDHARACHDTELSLEQDYYRGHVAVCLISRITRGFEVKIGHLHPICQMVIFW